MLPVVFAVFLLRFKAITVDKDCLWPGIVEIIGSESYTTERSTVLEPLHSCNLRYVLTFCLFELKSQNNIIKSSLTDPSGHTLRLNNVRHHQRGNFCSKLGTRFKYSYPRSARGLWSAVGLIWTKFPAILQPVVCLKLTQTFNLAILSLT